MAEQPVVTLPASVEKMIEEICVVQSQAPLDFYARQCLAEIGEEQATQLLRYISTKKIQKTLGAFIIFMLNHPHPYSLSSPSKPSFQSPVPSQPLSTPSPSPVAAAAALSALGELEFRKAFLILSYCGRARVENVVSADYITSLKDLPMQTFERRIWEKFGERYIVSKSDRQLYADWDPRRTHIYQCDVSPDWSLRFKGPILQPTRTHLQKCLGDDNVLLVKFSEDKNVSNTKTTPQDPASLYEKFGKEGIRVGLRLYRFFVFKDGGKEAKKKDPTTSSVKCYFVRTESNSSADEACYILSNKTMFEARSLFMHIYSLPNIDKYMARFSLILSKTITLKIDLATVTVETIEDEYCRDNGNIIYHNGKPRILTDGTGFISEDLAVLCPNDVVKGMHFKNKYMEELSNLVEHEDMSKAMGEVPSRKHQPPLLIQCRLFHMGRAIKGTLLVNKKLPPRTIRVRPSMIKVETDSCFNNFQSINSLEVVNTSNKPRRSYLSKYLIALLSYGGVPNEFFMDVLRTNLEDTDHVYFNKRTALRASANNGEMDEYNAAEMILCGIPLDEPFLHSHLSTLAKQEVDRLRGGKLYLPDCFYLMGTVDPTGCLAKNQVCIIHDNGQITGDVLVYHNPGLHFGDIHILQAIYVDGLESYVGHGKYVIFFPCVGHRSIADEIAGADFDGDMFWVSKNPQLLQYFKQSDPWIESPSPCNPASSSIKVPSALSAEELEEELFKLFLETRFQSSFTMGLAADSWMALMDRFLILRNDCTKEREKIHVRENMLKLIDIYYEALDAPKKGGVKIQVPKDLAAEMFPHYMEKDKSFTSTSILGLIYDEVCRYQNQTNVMSGKEIRKLPCFDVEIPARCMRDWEILYKKYRMDMRNALSENKKEDKSNATSDNLKSKDKSKSKDAASEVIKFYKEKLYGSSNMEDSRKSINDIYNEALAVYHVTYNYAIQTNDVSKCGFAWKIAGSALTRLYTILQQNQKPLTCNPSALREIFGS